MSRVSFIIAARNETYLYATVADILAKASGDIEVLVAFDGPPFIKLPDDKRVRAYHRDAPSGLKPCINMLAYEATGKYLFKLDAHCLVSPGIDEVLQKDMEPAWMVVPRFYTLDAERWEKQDDRFCDYWMLDCPLVDPKGYRFKAGGYWWQRTQDRLSIGPVDETMTHHGSGWFVERDFFVNKLGGMVIEGYGASYMEPADLGLRTWVGPWGGKVMCNKKAYYMHAHKGKQRQRGYGISMREIKRSYLWTAEHWMRRPDFALLVERFMPIPGWPANWQDLQRQYERAHPEAVPA